MTTKKFDPYKTLRLKRNATPEQIDQAFRSLSRKYHPDRNPGNEKSSEKFTEIREAHAILSDPAKRQHWDAHGNTDFCSAGQEFAQTVNIVANAFHAAFSSLINNGRDPSQEDLKALMVKGLKRIIKESDKEIEAGKDAKKKFEKCLGRWKVETSEGDEPNYEPNVLESIVRQPITQIEAQIQQLQLKKEAHEKALTLLKRYVYTFDAKKDDRPKSMAELFGVFSQPTEIKLEWRSFPGDSDGEGR